MDVSPNQPITKRPLWVALLNVLRETGIYLLFGLIGALVLLGLFAELTEDIFANEFTRFDDGFELWIHSYASSGLDLFFNFFTTIGGIPGMLILTALTFGLLVWRRHLHSAWLVVLAVGGGILLNQALKFLFQRPRPELWALTGHVPTTFSFPSGHSMVSLCYFGIAIWLGLRFIPSVLARTGWTILMIFFILMVGLSRIYFGVHYPTDVIGGYISGGFWLVVLLNAVAIYDRLHGLDFLKPEEF